MKGTVYTGIVYLPKHANADIHGLLRCIVRTKGMSELASILRVYDIPFSRLSSIGGSGANRKAWWNKPPQKASTEGRSCVPRGASTSISRTTNRSPRN